MPATVTRVTTRREAQVFLELDEPADVDMLPMPMRLDPDVNPDPVVRAVVTLRTEDGRPLQPLLTLATARGRYVHAGIGQNPDERDDSLLQRFAGLIDAARERVAYLDTPPAPADPPRLDPASVGLRFALAPTRHLGTTDTRTLHVCQHGQYGAHTCACRLGVDHQHGQDGSTCGAEVWEEYRA